MTEQKKFSEQLSQAKKLLDQAGEEKAISIAETKQQMHSELLKSQDEGAQLRERAKEAGQERDDLKQRLEDAEKTGKLEEYYFF